MTDTHKLETAILKQLTKMNGKREGLSSINWATLLQPELGWVDPAEVESAMKRFSCDGIVLLTKYDEKLGGRHEYRLDDGPAVEKQFFGFGSFDVVITDQGRRFLNPPRGPIGFQPS